MNWYLKVLKNYVGFEGRASRSEYWYYNLFSFLAALILVGIGTQVSAFMALYYAYGLGTLIPGLAVSFRRLHDSGKSAFWLFIALVPVIGILVLLFFMVQPSESGKNKYGSAPN